VADALKHGAKVILGGKRHARGGNFYEPTILANVTQAMMVAREETFGPVAPLFKFRSEADVIAMANDTPFGLAAYFYARDVGRVWRVAEALECGIIGINEGIISSEVAPFGGYKQSGLGREGSHHGVEEFLEMKYLLMGGPVTSALASFSRRPSHGEKVRRVDEGVLLRSLPVGE
jgi:succinate-semialdehyde dehydrogenase/glutarate-semialdehyde dehydrogenase